MYGILTYIWLLFLVNVGKYSSPMDGMGYISNAPVEPRHGHESRVGGGDGRRQLGCITVSFVSPLHRKLDIRYAILLLLFRSIRPTVSPYFQWLFLVPLKGGTKVVYNATWRIICHLPPIKGTRNSY